MPSHDRTATARARHSFWILVIGAILAAGALSDALRDGPGPTTGLRVAASGLVLVVSVVLAARILLAVERVRARKGQPGQPGASGRPRRKGEEP